MAEPWLALLLPRKVCKDKTEGKFGINCNLSWVKGVGLQSCACLRLPGAPVLGRVHKADWVCPSFRARLNTLPIQLKPKKNLYNAT